MTFSQAVKEELLIIDIHEDYAKLELIACFKAIGSLLQENNALEIEIKTTHIKLAKRILQIVSHEYPNTRTQTIIRTTNAFKKNQKEYIVKIQSNVREILLDLKMINENQNLILAFNETDFSNVDKDGKRYYTMLFFCASGSINDPRKSGQYHLEIRCTNEKYLSEIAAFTKKYDINFKITKRKIASALYLNKSEEIGDFLNFIMSRDGLFEFEDIRIMRDMMLTNNRLNNADIANETKKLSAINKQIDAINYLKDNDLFKDLSEKQKLVADLRLKYPEYSLNELAEQTKGSISKSNFSHHLRKIVKRAEDDIQ